MSSVKRLRRIMMVSLVWLTAATVVVAGLPHSVCACPVKVIGLTASGCALCQPAKTKKHRQGPAAAAPCCKTGQVPAEPPASPAPVTKPAPGETSLVAPTCVRAFVPAETFVPPQSPTTLDQDAAPCPCVPADTSTGGLIGLPAYTLVAREAGQAPPPTDPLCLFQRLLI
jgi:hypothetical protein